MYILGKSSHVKAVTINFTVIFTVTLSSVLAGTFLRYAIDVNTSRENKHYHTKSTIAIRNLFPLSNSFPAISVFYPGA